MTKILVVCGPTATGKTSLAISLAQKFKGELVSADSKQVYKGLDIGTGKDIPPDFRKKGFYEYKGIRVWGYDLIGPKGQFSVSQFVAFARAKIREILRKGRLPILVGGTGLYIKAMVDGISTVEIPKKEALRKNLAGKETRELFEMLAQLDPIKAGSLNVSDIKNPRRLIRAIEIATWKLEFGAVPHRRARVYKDVLFIGLSAPKEVLSRKIEERVGVRLRSGIEKEISSLLKSGVAWDDQSMSSLGYRQWRDYFEGKKTRKEAIEEWEKEERKYAKRQITWFKKDPRINWFDITTTDWGEKVEKLVKRWYSS